MSEKAKEKILRGWNRVLHIFDLSIDFDFLASDVFKYDADNELLLLAVADEPASARELSC